MAILNKSTGSLFPLINDIKQSNGKNETPEPKLRRSVGAKTDVRVGDGMTIILSKIWGTLKKQEEFTKSFKKNITEEKKFRKESKDLMKANHQVILKSLNALNKDVTKVLSKILDVNKDSMKEDEKRIDEEQKNEELKKDFQKENLKETESSAQKRHEELMKALQKASIGGKDEEKDSVRKQKNTALQQLGKDLKKDIMKMSENVLSNVFGRSMGKFLSRTLPGLFKGMGRLAATPQGLGALAVTGMGIGVYNHMGNLKNKDEKLKDLASKGDWKSMQKDAEYVAIAGSSEGGGQSGDEVIQNYLKQANTPEASKALEDMQRTRMEEKADNEGRVSAGRVTDRSNNPANQNFPKANYSLPVDQAVVSSAMKKNRTIGGVTKDHNGVDLEMKVGTPVNAIGKGTVITAIKDDPMNGGLVQVKHPDGMISSYAHLSDIGVKTGQEITEGKEIGKSGGEPGTKGAGHSTKPHLHLALKDASGQFVDPQKYISGLGGVKEGGKVAKVDTPKASAIPARAQESTGDVTNTKTVEKLPSDNKMTVGTNITSSESPSKGPDTWFQDALAKKTNEPVDQMNKAILEKISLMDKNKAPAPATNIVTNNVINGGKSGGVSNAPAASTGNQNATIVRGQLGVIAPVSGIGLFAI